MPDLSITIFTPRDQRFARNGARYWQGSVAPSSASDADAAMMQLKGGWMCYRAGWFEEAGLDPPTRFPGSPGWERNVVLPTFQRVLLGELTPEAGVEVMMAGLEEAVNG